MPSYRIRALIFAFTRATAAANSERENKTDKLCVLPYGV